MCRFFILCFFLLANASQDNSVKFEAYIAELFELKVLDKKELEIFLNNLEKNLIFNPIDCNSAHCNSIKNIHREELEEYLEKDLNLSHIQMSIRKLLEEKAQNDQDREETKNSTQSIWRGHIPQRIAGDSSQTCVIKKDKNAYCWGKKTQDPEEKMNLHMPKNMGPIKEISAGGYKNPHICALKENGKVECWGNYDSKFHLKLSNIVQISSGFYGNYALSESGDIYGWGKATWMPWNGFSKFRPSKILELSLGHDFICSVTDEMKAECGGNMYGQTKMPEDLEFVESIATGALHTCVLLRNGTVRCWGDLWGTMTPPLDLLPVVQIAVNRYLSCALQTNGIAKCWGKLDEMINSKLEELGPLVQISLGRDQICAVKQNAKVHCFVFNVEEITVSFQENNLAPDEKLEVYIDDLLPKFEF